MDRAKIILGLLAAENHRRHAETASGKVARGLQSTYPRNCTLNPLAARNVAAGHVKCKTTAAQKRPDFQAFLDDIVKDVLPMHEVHMILDNYCT